MKDQNLKIAKNLARIKQLELNLIFEKEGWDYLKIFIRPYWIPKSAWIIEWKECKKYFLVNGIKFPIRQGAISWLFVDTPIEWRINKKGKKYKHYWSPYDVQREFGFEMGQEVDIDTFRRTLEILS